MVIEKVASALAVLAHGALAAAPPNIVLMVIDDVGHADLSMNGGDFPTPHLDALAATGVNMRRMYVQPVCSPTRSALMTGRYPFRTGLQHYTTLLPGGTAKLPLAPHQTLAELMAGAGYSTAAIGKWHLGYSKWAYTPTGRGFDSHVGYLQGQTDYYNKTLGGAKLQPLGFDFWHNQTRAPDDGSYTMRSYASEAERLAAEVWTAPGAKPFFLYYAQQEAHVPLERPPADEPEHLAHCAKVTSFPERQTLCMMMSALDAEVGRFVADLTARGLWENTLLWVVTDNGGMTDFRGDFTFPASASSNWPLRGGKTTLFEGGVRGVSFVNGGYLPAAARGTESHELMHVADIPVTLAARAGAGRLAEEATAGLDGVDLWPTLTAGATGARTEVPVNINPECRACQAVNKTLHGIDYSALIQRSADGAHDWKLVSGFVGQYDGCVPPGCSSPRLMRVCCPLAFLPRSPLRSPFSLSIRALCFNFYLIALHSGTGRTRTRGIPSSRRPPTTRGSHPRPGGSTTSRTTSSRRATWRRRTRKS